MKLAVASYRKGSGKTTIALNMAAAMARYHGQVLLVDGDPAAPLEEMQGLSESGLVFDRRGTQIMRNTNVPGLALLEGFGRKAKENDESLRSTPVIERLDRDYACVVIDTSSEDRTSAKHILEVADIVAVPLSPDAETFAALPGLLRDIADARRVNPDLKLEGFIVSSNGSSDPAAEETLRRIFAEFGDTQFSITLSAKAEAVATAGLQPVANVRPDSEMAGLYEQLALELSARMGLSSVEQDDEAAIFNINMAETLMEGTPAPVPAAAPAASAEPAPAEASPAAAEPEEKRGALGAMLNWITRAFK